MGWKASLGEFCFHAQTATPLNHAGERREDASPVQGCETSPKSQQGGLQPPAGLLEARKSSPCTQSCPESRAQAP